MKHIVILDNSSANFWLIVDQIYENCPPAKVIYSNTTSYPISTPIDECGIVIAEHAATGVQTNATAIRVQ